MVNSAAKFAYQVRLDLLPELSLVSVCPDNPIVVQYYPTPWQLLGSGNHAAVFAHPDYPDLVAKIYAPGCLGLEDEADVYRRLGDEAEVFFRLSEHPAFSQCLFQDDQILILKKLNGITFWDAIQQAVPISGQAIRDVDLAVNFARSVGLTPHDIHGKNLMISKDGRGLIVDVSDFLKPGHCSTWDNLKRAYHLIYVPIVRPLKLRVPFQVLEFVRVGYRILRKFLCFK